MKKWMMCSLIGLTVIACDKDDDDELNGTDREYIQMASYSNNAESQAGALAATKGNTVMVRMFGQHMVGEHTTAQADLRMRASAVGINTPDTVDAEHKAAMAYLNTLSGYSFDTAYMNRQITDHAKTINLFRREIDNGQHEQIRGYAQQYLPGIEKHYTSADSIRRVL